MITHNEVYTAVYDAVAPIFTFPGEDGPNIWENQVTGNLPEYAPGMIRPGVILQMRHSVPVADEGMDGTQRLDARVHRLQTRPFAQDNNTLRDAVDQLMVALVGLRVGQYSLRLTTEDEPAYDIHRDPEIDRPYTYMHWRFVG